MADEEQHRRSEDRTAQDIQDMLKDADDREKREMLLLLQRLSEGVQTAITTGQINNQMTLNGNSALQAHIEEFNKFKELATKKWNGAEGAWGVVSRVAPWVASVLWAIAMALGAWGGNKLVETSSAITTHLAVSAAGDANRDSKIEHIERLLAEVIAQHQELRRDK